MDRWAKVMPSLNLQGFNRVWFWMAVVAVQLALVVLALIEPKLAFAIIGAALLFFLALKYPFLAVLGVIAARLLSTSALSLRIGPASISAFEPMYVMTFVAILMHTAQDRKSRLHIFDGGRLLLALLIWAFVSVAWSPDRGEGLAIVIRLGIAFALIWLLSSEIRTPERFYTALWTWIGVTCLYVLLGQILGVSDSSLYSDVQFKTMQGGNRVGGLGQHPNWFAMGIAFAVNPALALAYSERNRKLRLLAAACALWMILGVISTGSRGALMGVGVGSVFMALHNKRLMALLSRYWIVIVGLFAAALLYGLGSLTGAFYRIATRGISTLLEGDVRVANWKVCLQMIGDTFGFGIGGGGYSALVHDYDDRLAMGLYAYPHGIVWDVMAHYGIIGLGLLVAFSWYLMKAFRATARDVRGTSMELWLIGMGAGVVSYWTHGLVEFHFTDKPYWAFVGLFLGLIAAARQVAKDPEALRRYLRKSRAASDDGQGFNPPDTAG